MKDCTLMKSTPRAFEVVDWLSSFFWTCDRERTREARFGSIQHRSGNNHARTHDRAGGSLPAPLQQRIQVASHISDAGDPIGYEERQPDFLTSGNPITEDRVDMHIPQARDEKLAFGIQHAGVGRELGFFY